MWTTTGFTNKLSVDFVLTARGHVIRELVDSLCRDGADAQYMIYFKQKPYNFTTNTLKLI